MIIDTEFISEAPLEIDGVIPYLPVPKCAAVKDDGDVFLASLS